jgi:hypothetical protein
LLLCPATARAQLLHPIQDFARHGKLTLHVAPARIK